ncbi:hypothetical protein RhiJN_02754 [Ceratobasidium sp. AG-Ba]|nr:hypothetical protein RhiJN_02754 [Ceratobasidium sp. AG-Ba]QRW03647.1 hypothetical protein RhiLY_02646 [Ceratobasidium sp. AG-Ba]
MISIDDATHLSPFPKHHKVTPVRLDSILNWQVLLDYLNGRPLLPNLDDVTLRYPDYIACLNWLKALLSPTVHNISATYTYPEWPMEIVTEMLQVAEHRCPDLYDLFIPVRGFEIGHIDEDTDPDTLPQRQLQLISRFAPFQKLTDLRSNTAILYPQALPVLGQLPCLRRVMVGVGDTPPLRYDIVLPETAFPCLQYLTLEQVTSCDWLTGLWSVEGMFKHLEELSIEMNLAIIGSEHDEDWVDEFFSRLCMQSPKLADLSVLAEGGYDGEPARTFSRATQEHFRLLPFKSLMIRGLCFEDGCHFLASAWPDIVALSFCEQKASLADLVEFAQKLPNLQKLELAVDMAGSNVPNKMNPSISDEVDYRVRESQDTCIPYGQMYTPLTPGGTP